MNKEGLQKKIEMAALEFSKNINLSSEEYINPKNVLVGTRLGFIRGAQFGMCLQLERVLQDLRTEAADEEWMGDALKANRQIADWLEARFKEEGLE